MESDEQLVTGFHHNTVLSLAPEIIDAVKREDKAFLCYRRL